jgi:hypothetical protein
MKGKRGLLDEKSTNEHVEPQLVWSGVGREGRERDDDKQEETVRGSQPDEEDEGSVANETKKWKTSRRMTVVIKLRGGSQRYEENKIKEKANKNTEVQGR